MQDVQESVDAVAPPLDVHRALVVAFDDERGARKFFGLGVADREAHPLRGRHLLGCDRGAGTGIGGEDHFDRLVADGLAQNRRPAVVQIALIDVILVGIDRALDNGLAKAVRRRDEHHLIESGLGVERKHDAGRAQITADHALHAGRQRNVAVGKVLMYPVGNGAIVVE